MLEVLKHIREQDKESVFSEFAVPLRELPDGRLIEGTMFHAVGDTREPSWLTHAEELTGLRRRTGRNPRDIELAWR
jgi:hypothetical protein